MEKPKNPEQYIGRKVRMIDKNLHKINPDWYPKVNTVGTIIHTDNSTVLVNWGKESGVEKNCEGKYEWHVAWNKITPVNFDMTDEEIWEMFKPKMEKLGINYDGEVIVWKPEVDEPVRDENEHFVGKIGLFTEETVQKLVAVAYKSGYGRGQKGRPFVIGKKKQQGPHWEWIKPNEIVPDGTKVRYARKVGPSGNSIWTDWKIGYEGKVTSEEDWGPENAFWVDHSCFDSSRDCFQKWVGDDE